MTIKAKSEWLLKIQSKSKLVESGCIEWQAARTARGYGLMRGPRCQMRVARFLMRLLLNRNLQPEEFVCHKCDNPSCVNPGHLFIGTPKENSQDCVSKGRTKPTRGEKQWKSKLSDVQVAEVRRIWSEGKLSQRAIADQFGMTQSGISVIVTGKTRVQKEAV